MFFISFRIRTRVIVYFQNFSEYGFDKPHIKELTDIHVFILLLLRDCLLYTWPRLGPWGYSVNNTHSSLCILLLNAQDRQRTIMPINTLYTVEP